MFKYFFDNQTILFSMCVTDCHAVKFQEKIYAEIVVF